MFLVLFSCAPVHQAGRDEPVNRQGPEDQLVDAGLDAEVAEPDSDVEAGSPDGSVPSGDAGPSGPVLARSKLNDAGAELRVESIDGGYGFRLVASKEQALALEPLGLLEGASKVGLYFGRGCPEAPAGGAVFLGRWTGEVERCVTEPQPMGVIVDGAPRPGCPVVPVAPGPWTLSIYSCGRYAEPLGQLAFEVAARPGQPEPTTTEPPATKVEPERGPAKAAPAKAAPAKASPSPAKASPSPAKASPPPPAKASPPPPAKASPPPPVETAPPSVEAAPAPPPDGRSEAPTAGDAAPDEPGATSPPAPSEPSAPPAGAGAPLSERGLDEED